jgi:chromosome segregation ATPase
LQSQILASAASTDAAKQSEAAHSLGQQFQSESRQAKLATVHEAQQLQDIKGKTTQAQRHWDAAATEAHHMALNLQVVNEKLQDQKLQATRVKHKIAKLQQKMRLTELKTRALQLEQQEKQKSLNSIEHRTGHLKQKIVEAERDREAVENRQDAADTALHNAQQQKKHLAAMLDSHKTQLKTQEDQLLEAYETSIAKQAEQHVSKILQFAKDHAATRSQAVTAKTETAERQQLAKEESHKKTLNTVGNKALNLESERLGRQSGRFANQLISQANRFHSGLGQDVDLAVDKIARTQAREHNAMSKLEKNRANRERNDATEIVKSSEQTGPVAAATLKESNVPVHSKGSRQRKLEEALVVASRMPIGLDAVELIDLSPADVFVVEPIRSSNSGVVAEASKSEVVQSVQEAVDRTKQELTDISRQGKVTEHLIKHAESHAASIALDATETKDATIQEDHDIDSLHSEKEQMQTELSAISAKIEIAKRTLESQNAEAQDLANTLAASEAQQETLEKRLSRTESALATVKHEEAQAKHKEESAELEQATTAAKLEAAQFAADSARVQEQRQNDVAADGKSEIQVEELKKGVKKEELIQLQQACQQATDTHKEAEQAYKRAIDTLNKGSDKLVAKQQEQTEARAVVTIAVANADRAHQAVAQVQAALVSARMQTAHGEQRTKQAEEVGIDIAKAKHQIKELEERMQQLVFDHHAQDSVKVEMSKQLQKIKAGVSAAQHDAKETEIRTRTAEAAATKAAIDVKSTVQSQAYKQEALLKDQEKLERATHLLAASKDSYNQASVAVSDSKTELTAADEKLGAVTSVYRQASRHQVAAQANAVDRRGAVTNAENDLHHSEKALGDATKETESARAKIVAAEADSEIAEKQMDKYAAELQVSQDQANSAVLERDAILAPLDKQLGTSKDMRDESAEAADAVNTELTNAQEHMRRVQRHENAAAEIFSSDKQKKSDAKQAQAELYSDVHDAQTELLHLEASAKLSNATFSDENSKLSNMHAKLTALQNEDSNLSKEELGTESGIQSVVSEAKDKLQQFQQERAALETARAKLVKLGHMQADTASRVLVTGDGLHSFKASLKQQVHIAEDAYNNAKEHVIKPGLAASSIDKMLKNMEVQHDAAQQLERSVGTELSDSREHLAELSKQHDLEESTHTAAVQQLHQREQQVESAQAQVSSIENDIKLSGPLVSSKEQAVGDENKELDQTQLELAAVKDTVDRNEERLQDKLRQLQNANTQLAEARSQESKADVKLQHQKKVAARAAKLIEQEFTNGIAP